MTEKFFHQLQFILAATGFKNKLPVSVPGLPTPWIGGECCFVEFCRENLRTGLIQHMSFDGVIRKIRT